MIVGEFFSELPNEESKKIIIANTYDIYSSFIDAIKEFSKKPHSLELTLDSTNGINIVPDLEMMLKENNKGDGIKLDNYQFISTMMVIDSILSSDDAKLMFEANSKIK